MLNLFIYCLAFFPALITPSHAQSDTATFAGVLAVSGGTVIIILIIWIAICCFCFQDERDFCELKKRLRRRREQYRRYRQRQQIQRLLLQQRNRPRISVQPLGNVVNSPTNPQPVGQEIVRPPQEPPVANTKRPSLSPQLFAPSQLPQPPPDPPTPSPPPPTSVPPPSLLPPLTSLQPPLQPLSPILQPPLPPQPPLDPPPPLSSPPPLAPPPPPLAPPPPSSPPPPPSAPPTLPLSPLDSGTEFQQPSPPRPRDGGEANRETESINTPTMRLNGDSDERNEVLNSVGGRRVHFNEGTGEENLENSSALVPVPIEDLQQQPHDHDEDPTLREDLNTRSNTGGVGRWSPKFLREEEEVDVTLDESSSPPRYSWIFSEDEFQRDRSSREWWRISLGERRGGESGGRRGRERDDMAAFGQLNTWPQLTF